MKKDIVKESINTIRALCIDGVERAKSGHMGMPLGAAPMAYTLWRNHLNVNPKNPDWFNRDRFILSAGHGSMLLYSLLHLSGYDLSLEELKKFRVIGSKTPGHPEFGITPGVDATTGPLGQGIAMAVGMALAEKHLSSLFNKEDFNIVDHYTYALCGDGCLMEGISYEAMSLAGHLKLNKLIVLYDSNSSTLDSKLDASFSEDIKKRAEALGWNYIFVPDGNDVEKINEAIERAKESRDKPTLIEVKTIIGYGLSKIQGTNKAHSDPVGSGQAREAKNFYGWEYKEEFFVPAEVYDDFKEIGRRGMEREENWQKQFQSYRKEYPELHAQLTKIIKKELPENWDEGINYYLDSSLSMATRNASHDVLNAVANNIPALFGGTADLSTSTKVKIVDSGAVTWEDFSNRNIYFGIREFAMAGIANGLALHHLRPFVSTYFTFSDYMKSAIRLSALMGLPVIYIFTHDSVAVGKDGPTHQPIEQLASFRAMPNVNVIRPADGNETVAAWKVALKDHSKPTILVLGRQNVPILPNSDQLAEEGVEKGAYVLSKAKSTPDGILIATGSEVELAIESQKLLEEENIFVNVVSFPSWNLFEQQPESYKEEVLPKDLKRRLTIEMASQIGWKGYAGDSGDVMSVDDFGLSGDPNDVIEHFGFTAKNVAERFKKLLKHP